MRSVHKLSPRRCSAPERVGLRIWTLELADGLQRLVEGLGLLVGDSTPVNLVNASRRDLLTVVNGFGALLLLYVRVFLY